MFKLNLHNLFIVNGRIFLCFVKQFYLFIKHEFEIYSEKHMKVHISVNLIIINHKAKIGSLTLHLENIKNLILVDVVVKILVYA